MKLYVLSKCWIFERKEIARDYYVISEFNVDSLRFILEYFLKL